MLLIEMETHHLPPCIPPSSSSHACPQVDSLFFFVCAWTHLLNPFLSFGFIWFQGWPLCTGQPIRGVILGGSNKHKCLMVSETYIRNPMSQHSKIGHLRARTCHLHYDYGSLIFHKDSPKSGLTEKFHGKNALSGKLRKLGCNQTSGQWPSEIAKVTL